MCQPIDWVLRVVNTIRAVLDAKNGVLTLLIVVLLGGFAGMAYLYNDAKSERQELRTLLVEFTKFQAVQTEVLRTIDSRLTNLENNK